VDNAAVMTIHDPFTRDFVRDFLAADNPELSPEDALSALNLMNQSTSVSNMHVLFAAQIFFRYLLLDVCADAYGLPPAEFNRIMPSARRPSWGVEKMHKVSLMSFRRAAVYVLVFSQTVVLLQDWPKIITKFRNMYSSAKGGSVGQTPLAISDGDATQRMFLVGLQSLNRAHVHHASKLFDKVMFNIEVLAFSIWWVHMVSSAYRLLCKTFLTFAIQGICRLSPRSR
jgi:hypothetical protein